MCQVMVRSKSGAYHDSSSRPARELQCQDFGPRSGLRWTENILTFPKGEFIVYSLQHSGLSAMESISRLRTVLLNALSSRGHGEQDLFDELMLHKQRLLELFEVGQSSQQEQQELQSGACFTPVPTRKYNDHLRKNHDQWQVIRDQC